MNSIFISTRKWFFSFVYVQLFLLLVSLPVLTTWGLPISYMTPLGNLFFGPFLTLFLLCSSLIFFTELLHIPNTLLIFALEKTTQLWLYFLNIGSKTWLCGFPLSLTPMMIIAAVACFIIIQHKKWGSQNRSSSAFLVLLACIIVVAKFHTPTQKLTLSCNKKTLEAKLFNSGITLIDQGALTEKQNMNSWICYTLLPSLTKTFGTCTIDKIILTHSNKRTLDSLLQLCKETSVRIIVMPPNKIIFDQTEYNNLIEQGIIIQTHTQKAT